MLNDNWPHLQTGTGLSYIGGQHIQIKIENTFITKYYVQIIPLFCRFYYTRVPLTRVNSKLVLCGTICTFKVYMLDIIVQSNCNPVNQDWSMWKGNRISDFDIFLIKFYRMYENVIYIFFFFNVFFNFFFIFFFFVICLLPYLQAKTLYLRSHPTQGYPVMT